VELRHRRGDRDALDPRQVEEVAVERAQLVAAAVALGRHAPVLAQLLALEEPEDRLRVPDVDRQERHARQAT
jgi:hypothetical protein